MFLSTGRGCVAQTPLALVAPVSGTSPVLVAVTTPALYPALGAVCCSACSVAQAKCASRNAGCFQADPSPQGCLESTPNPAKGRSAEGPWGITPEPAQHCWMSFPCQSRHTEMLQQFLLLRCQPSQGHCVSPTAPPGQQHREWGGCVGWGGTWDKHWRKKTQGTASHC